MSCSKNGTSDWSQVQSDWLDDRASSARKPRSMLPVAGERNILITSALPYVNNVPHLGNIIGCVLSADVFARYCRLCDYNVLFICGTDEYGTATETKALQEGMTPREICDKYFKIHESIYDWFEISFDKFGRTSSSEQTEICQEVFLELYKKNYMSVETVEQLKCEKCDRFLADRFVVGTCPHPGCGYVDARGDQCDGCGRLVNAIDLVQPKCNVCATAPIKMNSEQFFFDLPQLEERLKVWMNESSKNWSNNARIIGKSYMRDGLKQRCITRDLKWGIPVPLEQYKNKVFYVWFDAPIGYFSITKSLLKDDWVRWWKDPDNVELFQFMAKDNVPFHAVLFPCTLIGVDQKHTMVSRIMATEYLNYEDGKFSKSRGVGVFGNDAQSTGIEADIWRFYLVYVRPETQDSSFSWSDLAYKNNNELLNNLGNFVNRSFSFLEKFFDKTMPEMSGYKLEDWTLIADSLEHVKSYIAALENGKLIDGIRHILAISRLGNQYFQVNQPWMLVKGDQDQKNRAALVIGICVNISYHLSVLLSPYMPKTSERIRAQLNQTEDAIFLNSKNPTLRCVLKAGHKIGKVEPLFTRITDEMIVDFKNKFGNSQKSGNADEKTNGGPLSESDLEALKIDLENQALKVRTLKAQGMAKADLQPEIELLLNLKKQLNISTKK